MNTQVILPDAEDAVEKVDQPTLYLNWQLELADGTILNNSHMRLVDFSGQEQLSSPFQFTLTLHGNTDFSQSEYKMGDLIGRAVTVGICLRDSKDDVDNGPFKPPVFAGADPAAAFNEAMQGSNEENFSFFNGMVTGFTMGIPGVYSLTMKPALWRLMLTNDYCVHSQLSIRTVIESLMKKHQLDYNTEDLIGDNNTASTRVQDWLQAGETDFDFMQRLLSKANIHFYFVHSPDSHQIVFSNKASYPSLFEEDRTLLYTYSEVEEVERADTLKTYNYSQNISATSVSSAYTRQEAAWESDTVAGEISFYSDPTAEPGDLPFHIYKIIQYGGSAAAANGFAGQVTNMIDSASTELDGSSNCPEIRVGHKVQIDEGTHSGPSEVCPYLNQKWFVFTEAQHQASLDGTYSCKFKATEADSLITPFDPHNTHQGTVLAEVVAHCNGDMPSTWKYYEKTVFSPESSPETDTGASNSGVVGGIDPSSNPNPKVLMATGLMVRFTSSPNSEPVFVRLSASMQTCPEVGSMVIVARASDESELPEVQQSVQANGSMAVTPSRWTSNTHVGSSYSTNYGDSKSVRYGRISKTDLESAIAMINTQYDTGVFKDVSYSQGGGYSYSTSESGRTGMLSKSKSLGNTYSHHEGETSDSYSDVTTQTSESINGTVDGISTIKSWSKSHHHNHGDTTSFNQVDGTTSSTNIQNIVVSSNTTNGTTTSTNVFNAKTTDTSTHNADVESHSTNNGNITSHSTHNGNSNNTSVQTGNSKTDNTVNGNVTNTSTTTGTENSTTVRNTVITDSTTATSTNTSKMGASVDASLVGATSHNSLTGASNNNSLVGASLNINLLGATLDTNLTGARVSMSLVGSSNEINILGERNSLSVTGDVMSLGVTAGGVAIELSDVVNVNLPLTNVEIPGMHMKV